MTEAKEPTEAAELLRHGNWVQAIAYAVVRDHQLAEDVRQDIFLAALEGKWSGAMLRKRWLAATSKNRALNVIRGRSRAEARESKRKPSPPPVNPLDIVEAIDAQKIILAALETLSPKGKRVIYLRFFHDWTYSEIGKEFGISSGAARVQTHRTLVSLRKKLEHKREDWLNCCMAAIGLHGLPKLAGAITAPVAMVAAAGLLLIAFNLKDNLNLALSLQTENDGRELHVADARNDHRGEGSPSPFSGHERVEVEEVTQLLEKDAAPFPDPDVGIEKVKGIVTHNRIPYPDAEIKVIHAGRYWTTYSDVNGRYELELYQGVGYSAVVLENGLFGQSNSLDGLERIELHELEDPSIYHLKVVDNESRQPIANVAVDFIVPIGYWTGSQIQDLSDGLTIGSGVTDHEGKVSMEDYPFHMTLAARIDHPGFQIWLGNIHVWPTGGLARLRRQGKEKSVQVNDTQGVGIADAVVWAGFASKLGRRTDADGRIDNHELLWRERVSGGKKFIRSAEVVVQLPSGRYWAAGGWMSGDQQRPGCKTSEDLLEIEVHDAPVQVHFSNPARMPEGLQVEVARVDARNAFQKKIITRKSPIVVGGGTTYQWHSVTNYQSTWIEDGCVGAESWVVARDAKNLTFLGASKVEGDSCTLNLNLAQVAVNLPPPPNSMDHEWVLHLEPTKRTPEKTNSTVIAAANGAFSGWVPLGEYRVYIAHRDGWGKSKLNQDLQVHEQRTESIDIGPNGLVGTIQPPNYEFHPIQIRINGIPSLGGWVVNCPVDLDGMVSMKCNEKGEGLVRWGRFITPGELLLPPNGPVVSRGFIPSSGAVIPLTDGYPKVWDIQLVTVELNLTSLPIERATKIQFQPLPQNYEGDYAQIPNEFSRDGMQGDIHGRSYIGALPIEAPLEAATFSFQIPAGRYRFKIGDFWFTDKGGINLVPGRTYLLGPQKMK